MFTARVMVQPSDEGRETVIARLVGEMDVVPTTFAGCSLFVVSVDAENPKRVLIAEEWESRAAFEAYTGSDHFAEIMSTVGPLLAGPPDSAYYEAERVGP